MRTTFTALLVVTLTAGIHSQQTAPPSTSDHHAAVASRGDQAMGFSHEKTTHHFRLYTDGGAIEVQANEPGDADSRNMIRMHLQHIAKMFSAGDFNTPMFIHDTNPPGVRTMKELRDRIRYDYEETDRGARVRIRTVDPHALDAIQAFLLFQIVEHQTGDPAKISEEGS